MKHLINIMKMIEIDIRSDLKLSKHTYIKLSKLSDWENRIIQDFILRVNMAIKNNDLNFVYRYFEKHSENITNYIPGKVDLVIALLKRDKNDTVLTDVYNRLAMPKGITTLPIEIWGLPVTQARNFAIKQACKLGAKFILFVDDDIIAPNNALLKLWDTYNKTNSPVVAGDYSRKIYPVISAHGDFTKTEHDGIYETNLCAMGFTLINLEYVLSNVPTPIFWEFGAPDGYWSMGEDAFFSKNLIENTGKKPIVDTNIKLLHYDKIWKKWFGEKDNDCVYATNILDTTEKFESLRVPATYPLIAICIPTRKETDPISCNLDKLLLKRGYRSELIRVANLPVDQAREHLVKEALKINADFVLFIDNDIAPPIDGVVKLLDKIETDKSIGCVSGDYLLKGKVSHSAHLQLSEDGLVTELNLIKDKSDDIQCNWLIGLGFALCRTSFFKQAREPWFLCHSFKGDSGGNEDAHMSELMFINGFKIFVRRDIKCGHIDFENKICYSYKEEGIELATFDWFNDIQLEEK